MTTEPVGLSKLEFGLSDGVTKVFAVKIHGLNHKTPAFRTEFGSTDCKEQRVFQN